MSYESDKPCTACGLQAPGMVCGHHVLTRAAFPELKDDPLNIMPMCAWCHTEIHKKGTNYMASKFPGVKEWLDRNGYEIVGGKWRRTNGA